MENIINEINDWSGVLSLVLSSYAILESKRSIKRSYAIDTLTAVIDAAESTQTYQQLLQNGKQRDTYREYGLAEKWANVALMTSDLDKDLSVRLDVKSKFWRSRDTWTEVIRAHKDISLESVVKDAKRLRAKFV